jgi:GT2 family glycosyltransferase
MGSPTVSVVIVDHRRPDLVREALHALTSGVRLPDEVVVVEADSDQSLEGESPPGLGTGSFPVEVLRLADNPGYAAACNRGYTRTRGDWVLFLNADVTVAPGCVGRVLEVARSDPGIGVVTCRLVRVDGRLDHACHRGIPTPLESLAYKLHLHRLFPRSRRFGHYTLSWMDVSGTHDIEACSGAFLLIRRDVLEAVGGWDERYWFYAEDLDLCLRVSRAGWRIRYVGDATATHLKGASSHMHRSERELGPEERAVRRRVQRAVIDSHLLFYREHQEATTASLFRPLIRTMFKLQRMRIGDSA